MPEPRLFGRPDGDGHPEFEELLRWHAWLRAQPQRGERARLRRASDLTAAALTPAFHDLVRRLRETGRLPDPPRPWQLERLAALAMTAAVVERHDGTKLAVRMGRPAEPGRGASVSPARFRRLLESQGLEQRVQLLRRLLRLAGGGAETRASLYDLAGIVFHWTPYRRRSLAYDYYRNAPKESMP